MTDISDIIDSARNERWSGKIEIDLYFGEVKKVRVGTTIDMERPVDMSRFKQGRRDPFQDVVGQ